MNSLYPIITALLSTFLILISSICLRRMYWAREEKRRLMALGRRFDRYILKNGDTYLDTNNIPEWFKRYNRFKIHADVAKMPDKELHWDHATEPIGKVISEKEYSMGASYLVDASSLSEEDIEKLCRLKERIENERF